MIPIFGFGSDALTKTFPKKQFNIVSGYVDQPASSEIGPEMLRRPQIGRMGFEFSERGLRVVLQIEVGPLAEVNRFASSDNIENLAASRTVNGYSSLVLEIW